MARKTVLHIYKRIHGYNGKKKKDIGYKKQNPNKKSKWSLRFQASVTKRILMPLI